MRLDGRASRLVLIVGFVGIIYGVPISQIGLEIHHHRPVQCTDLIRYRPSVRNLRRFEQTMEDTWWGQQTVRPAMQRSLYLTLRDTGPKAVAGRDGWMFYRPGVQYLVRRDRLDVPQGDSVWVAPSTRQTARDHVVEAIVRFRDQLAKRGLKLLVVPVPGKASVYPDKLTARAEGKAIELRSPTRLLLQRLAHRGVATVDLLAVFRAARRSVPRSRSAPDYFLARDTHWTPAGAKMAAAAVARRLQDLGWIAAEGTYPYSVVTVAVRRYGDVIEMMRVPGLRGRWDPQRVECRQVQDPIAGLLTPRPGGRAGTFQNTHLIDTPLESAVLLLGDSFCRIYQTAEPASLGCLVETVAERAEAPSAGAVDAASRRASLEGTHKRLLPGSAGFPSQLAYQLKAPVDYIVSDGGAATDVRRRLSTNSEILTNKRVVIWEFAEREIGLGRQGWKDVPLPAGW